MKRKLCFSQKIKFSALVLFLVLLVNTSYSQVSGISASKIGAYCVETVPLKDLEFEPSFNFGRITKIWDSEKKLKTKFSTSDSVETFSGLAFRCTYGLTEKLEIGMSAPADVSGFSIAMKQISFRNDRSGLAIIAGINLELANGVKDQSEKNPYELGSYVAGFCISHKVSNRFHLDFDIQGQRSVNNVRRYSHSDVFVNSDVGFYIKEHAQLICGLSYMNTFYTNSEINNSLFSIHPGISFETGDNFLIVLSSNFGLYGKNTNQCNSINIAFTMTIR